MQHLPVGARHPVQRLRATFAINADGIQSFDPGTGAAIWGA
jgi:hypothetical protein